MTREEYSAEVKAALAAFEVADVDADCDRYGNGHINDTFAVNGKDGKRYILHRVNHEVFTEPEKLMSNVEKVTQFLREKIQQQGGDPERETLNLVRTKEGKTFYRDRIGCYWRMYHFIEDTTALEQARNKEDFYQSAIAFGNFQSLLSDFDASRLYETIPDFHNTPIRFRTFQKAVEEDVCGRAACARREIDFYMGHRKEMEYCAQKLAEGAVPLRVTHNDTKLNNVLLDARTGKAVCVIDLDTVMPGLAAFDFGDSIRFGANTAVEDERDLSKVSLDLELFETYVKGYLEGCKGSLTEAEVEMLSYGALTMTLECGMRFLTDHLQGDVYFMIHRENHNLDRSRTQMALVEDMERKWDQMQSIVSRYCQHS